MIDCGIGTFSKSDSAIDVGTIISTRITFNKKFNSTPVVVVSWREYFCNTYLDTVSIDNRTLSPNGFDAITTFRNVNSWKSDWNFYWIAIEQ